MKQIGSTVNETPLPASPFYIKSSSDKHKMLLRSKVEVIAVEYALPTNGNAAKTWYGHDTMATKQPGLCRRPR